MSGPVTVVWSAWDEDGWHEEGVVGIVLRSVRGTSVGERNTVGVFGEARPRFWQDPADWEPVAPPPPPRQPGQLGPMLRLVREGDAR